MDHPRSRTVSGSIDTSARPLRRMPHWSEIAAYGFALGAATVVLTAVFLEALGGQPIVPGPAPAVIVTHPPAVACPELTTPPPAVAATESQVTVRVVVDPPQAVHTEVEVEREPGADPGVNKTGEGRAPKRGSTPEREYGILRVGTEPGSRPALVHVDGVRVGRTPIASHRVAPGRHTVEFEWPDCPRTRRTVSVESDEATTVRAGDVCSDG